MAVSPFLSRMTFMKKLVLGMLVAAGFVTAACSTSNPAGQPTVSFTSPLASGPANGSSYKFKAQPVTLQITNAVRASAIPATYTVEVASDSSFNNKVFTQANIAEGNGGTTSVTVSNLLASSGNVTYYWRSFATVDGVDGPMSSTQTFVVQQQIVVNAPELSGPDSGITSVEPRVTLTTKNASRQGAVGAITYTFQLATTSAFSNPTTATVAEGSGGQTSWTPSSDLAAGTYFWRVQARDDTNTEVSAFTSARSFIVEPFDPKKAVFHHNFSDIATWPQTAKITSVEFNRSGMIVDFDRRTGSNKWPEVASFDFGPLQYTLGLCYKISGIWHCSAAIQFWDGRDLSESGPWDQIPENWYYDAARWGPMAGYRPERGELVMVWAGQGNLRGVGGATQVQRTNFAPVRWGEPYEAN
jgi:hypothetical protein